MTTQLPEVPALYPSDEEFRNPIEYLSTPAIAKLGVEYGMVKIVPPSSFKPPLSINESRFSFVPRIQKLKELNIVNRCRLFFFKQLLNFNKMNRKPLPRESFEEFQGIKVHYYDFFIEVVKYYKNLEPNKYSGKTLPNLSSHIILNDSNLWNSLSLHFKVIIPLLQHMYVGKMRDYFDFLSQKPEFTNTLIEEKYPTSLLSDHESDSESDNESDEGACLVCKKNDDPDNTLLCDSCDKPFHRQCLSPPLSKIPNDNWYCDNCVIGNGYYGFKDSSIRYSLEDFKSLSDDFDKDYFKGHKPGINVLEQMFWGLVDDIDNELKVNYGADIHNLKKGEVSGFPTREYIPKSQTLNKEQYNSYAQHPMNLNNLPFDKSSLLNYLDVDISGMTIPWIYIGNTFSTFCWHVEDQYTLSANYQHLGATKKWYSIPSVFAEEFESYMKNLAPDLFAKQPDILHQLITLVSPYDLVKHGIKCFTTNQQPGEYVVTYPRVYHAGFNAGFNFNEAVNFTMVDWLDFGVLATNNYKKNVDKISVFDIYEMITNILTAFINNEEASDKRLIHKCLELLKPRLTDEYSLQSTILERLDVKVQKHKKIKIQKNGSDEDVEEDGVLCSQCKGFCSFAYVKHYELVNTQGPKTVGYLPSPRSSPEESGESKRRSSKRIKLMKDSEVYKSSVLCLEDYLKKDANKEKDEFFQVKDKEIVKQLIIDAEATLGKV